MGNIGSLTVISSDGASDIVKTTTRTVAEAGAAVKGLTGIDVPGLLANAMGTAIHTNGGPTPSPAGSGGARGSGSGGTGGSAGGRGPGGGRGAPPPAAAGDGATAAPAPSTATAGALPPIDPGAAFERAGRAMTDAATATREAATAALPPLPPLTAPPASATPTLSPAAIATDRAIAPPRPAPRGSAAVPARPASADVGRDTTVDEAASRLAADLRSIPGIERFGGIRLADLDRSGPRPLRTMWRVAREQLDERWGQVTIGEIIDRYGSGPGGTGASA
jgi:hypothetical protein